MADFKIDDTVDITDVVCPTTFVKAKVALEELEEENPDIKLVKININFDSALAEKYEVLAAPTLIFFKTERNPTA